jgi:hypothetical protein
MEDSDTTPDARPEQKSTMAERLTGVHDPQDPDGLLTVEQDADRPDPSAFGHAETDTLEREQERYAEARAHEGDDRELPRPPRHDGVTGLDTTP